MMRRRPSPVSEARTFERHRPLLFSIAYRMLGSAMDAENVVQEAYLRWRGREGEVRFPKAYLCTAVTRLSIDRLRSGAVRVVRGSLAPLNRADAERVGEEPRAFFAGPSEPLAQNGGDERRDLRRTAARTWSDAYERMKGRNKDDQ